MKAKRRVLCQTCIYEKEHKGFRQALLQSNYFNVNSLDSIIDVMWKFQCPLKVINVQKHCLNHLKPMVEKTVEAKVAQALSLGKKTAQEVLQGEVVAPESDTYHEQVLDDVIKKSHQLLKEDKIKIDADVMLKALKIKADIEKSKKDRKLDALKAFAGMSGGNKDQSQAIPANS